MHWYTQSCSRLLAAFAVGSSLLFAPSASVAEFVQLRLPSIDAQAEEDQHAFDISKGVPRFWLPNAPNHVDQRRYFIAFSAYPSSLPQADLAFASNLTDLPNLSFAGHGLVSFGVEDERGEFSWEESFGFGPYVTIL